MARTALSLLLFAGLVIPAFGTDDIQPANINTKDTGDNIPIALFRGHVSNQPSRYILGPGDKVGIKVEHMDKFNQQFTIRPDGYATVHPFGEMTISGMDIQGLKSWLTNKYKFYLLEPNITVDLEEMRPAIVYLTGAVSHPGTYQFIRASNPATEKMEITLTNVLAKAGGLSEWADIDHIEVVHASTGQKETYSLRDLLADSSGKDIWLLPGDTVHVPKRQEPMTPETFRLVSRSTFYKGKFPVMVLGAVQHQGEVQLDPNNNSLNAALALAGGFVPQVSKTDAFIVQRPGNNGGFNRFIVDGKKVQFALQPGDVVYVADSKLSKVEHGLSILSKVAQPFFFGVNAWSGLNALQNGD